MAIATMGLKLFLIQESIPERSSYRYRVVMKASDGVTLIPPTDVASIQITLRDVTSGAIVNGRDHIQAKDQNGGTMGLGEFFFQLTEDDTAIVGLGTSERRVLTVDVRLMSGGRATREAKFYVRNLQDISS